MEGTWGFIILSEIRPFQNQYLHFSDVFKLYPIISKSYSGRLVFLSPSTVSFPRGIFLLFDLSCLKLTQLISMVIYFTPS